MPALNCRFALAAAACAASVLAPHAAAQETTKPTTAAPAAATAADPGSAAPSAAAPKEVQTPPSSAATGQPPAPTEQTPAASATPSAASSELPEVKIIQAPNPPKSVEDFRTKPKKKPVPVAEEEQAPAKKQPKKVAKSTPPATNPAPSQPDSAPEDSPAVASSADAYTPIDSDQTTDSAPGTREGGAGLGGRFTGYTATGASVASKDGLPILQNPVAVQVVPREALDDKQARSLQDGIVGTVSSVQPAGDGFYDGFTIRGFDNTNNIYRNNLKTKNFSHRDTVNLQSIEVLKGPAAMFFGRLEPGGIVNMVLKRPLGERYTSVEQLVDNWGMSTTSLDTTGALSDDKTWLYRVNLGYENGDTFRDFVEHENIFVAPTISFRPSSDFRLNVDLEYQDYTFVTDADTVIPAIGNRPAPIPISRYLQNPAITAEHPSTQERLLLGYDWTLKLGSDWSLTNRFAYEKIKYHQSITDISSFDEKTGIAQLGLSDVDNDRFAVGTNLDLAGKIVTGPLKHAILVGTDYRNSQDDDGGFEAYESQGGTIDIFNPVYQRGGYVKPTPDNFFFVERDKWFGVYGQDMISLPGDQLHFLFGGRYDWTDSGFGFSNALMAEAKGAFNPDTFNGFLGAREEAFSPRAGIIFQPMPWVSIYGSYSRSFGFSNALVAPGEPRFGPEEGVQWEGGIKTELLDKRVTATVAYYDLTKSNIVQTIPGTNFSRPVGLAESKGIEIDVAGRLDDNWSILAFYAYDNAEIVEDTSNKGNRLQNVPKHAGSLWLKYDAGGEFKGLSLGAGVAAMGDRFGDNENDYVLPAFARVDAMLSYQIPRQVLDFGKVNTLQFNVTNVLDETYYLHAYDRLSAAPGAPRTFLLSLRSEF